MAFGVKTNERPGTRAEVRYARLSAYKAREVLDLIRGKETDAADTILQFVERDAAIIVRKCLASAVANAVHNDQQPEDELYVSACFADEGPTLKRWRPRARGRATRIRKRTCHITVIVSRLSEEQLERRRAQEAASPTAARTRRAGRAAADARRARVARSRQAARAAEHDHEHEEEEASVEAEDTVETEDVAEDAEAEELEVEEEAEESEEESEDEAEEESEEEAEEEFSDEEPPSEEEE
jgi:large subunit ribosomal protein L22